MTHSVLARLDSLRRRARGVIWLHALGWLCCGLLGTIASLSLLDYLLRIDDRGIRWICSLGVVGVGAWLLARFVAPALMARFDDLYLAQRIERRYPQFGDALASTIGFLRSGEEDPLAGSAELRRNVISTTSVVLENIDIAQVVDARPLKRVGSALLVVLLCAGGLFLADRDSASLALTRLAAPWGSDEWPRQTHLVIDEPKSRIALGQRFEVEVRDLTGRALPDDMRFQFRYLGENEPLHTEAMRHMGEVVMAGVDNVTRPFQYRAEGGDDRTMPWHDLEVIEPPAVRELSLTLHYSDYTSWKAAVSDPHVRALVGTRIALAGSSTKPIRAAKIVVEPAAEYQALVSADGFGFSLPADAATPWVVKQSGSYRVMLEDTEGFASRQDVRYDLRAIEDRAPSIAIEEPAADSFVTAEAIVPLKLLAKDDLALQSVTIHWTRSDQSDQPEQTLAVFTGPKLIAGSIQAPSVVSGESRTIEHRLELSALGLKSGAVLTMFARASDYRPQSTQSHARRFTVVTPSELQERLAERQQFVLNELSRVIKTEREARQQVANVEIQLGQVGQLAKRDVDHLQQAELLQRQVERSLTSKTEGLPAHIASLLSEVQNNKLEAGETTHRMQELLNELQELAKAELPQIARDLTAALKDVQSTAGESKASPNAAKNLASAGKEQDGVIAKLEQRLGELSQWDNYRRFHRELGQLRRDQEQVRQETAEKGSKTLTKDQKDLSPQENADLKKLGTRQSDLARQFDKIQQRMNEMSEKLANNDQVAADALKDALQQAQEKAVGGQLREAGRNVDQNKIGEASRLQQQALNELDQMLDILSNRRENELGRLVKKLREAEQQLDNLRQQQQGLKKKLEENARNPDEQQRKRELERLTREQKQLQQDAERFARQLKRLQADRAGRSAERGGGKMAQAGQKGEQGDSQGAAAEAAQAEKDLEEAAQQLAEQRQKAESDLASEQMARLEDMVKGLAQQQEKLLTETKQYDARQQAAGRLSRAESLSVQDMGRQQQSLAEETIGTGSKLAAEVFQLAFKSAARDMTNAGKRLAQRDVSTETQRHEQHALARLKQLIAAAQRDKPEEEGKDQKQSQGGGGGSGGGGGQGQSLNQLKLLKLMQQDLNDRTRSIEESAAKTKSLTGEQQQEFLELSREQGELADLLLKLTTPKPSEKPVADDLEKLLKEADSPKPSEVKP